MKVAKLILASFLTVASLAGQPERDFKAADKNGDGRVSLKEFKKYRAVMMKKDGWSDPYHRIMSVFDGRDQDQDGYLSEDEMELEIVCNRLRDTFRERGWRMTFNEFETFVERMLLDQGRYAMRCQLTEAFDVQDIDRDGKLSRLEYVSIPPNASRRFQEADENRDLQLDINEFGVFAVGKDNLMLLAGASDVQGWVEHIFENRDEDEDEFLTRAELYESADERRKQFARADIDKDGSVDRREIQAFKIRESDLSVWRAMAMDQFRLNFISRDINTNGIITYAEYYSKDPGIGNQILFAVIK